MRACYSIKIVYVNALCISHQNTHEYNTTTQYCDNMKDNKEDDTIQHRVLRKRIETVYTNHLEIFPTRFLLNRERARLEEMTLPEC